MNTVKLIDIQKVIHNALHATFTNVEFKGKDLYFQQKFEKHHNCQIIKSYSQKAPVTSAVASIKYWHALQFESKADITMFILRWA
jgi:hypothetical protein